MRPHRIVLVHEAMRGAGATRYLQIGLWGPRFAPLRAVPSAELHSVDEAALVCVLCDGEVSPAVVQMWVRRTGVPVMVVGRLMSTAQMAALCAAGAGAAAVVDEGVDGPAAVRSALVELCKRKRGPRRRPVDSAVPADVVAVKMPSRPVGLPLDDLVWVEGAA